MKEILIILTILTCISVVAKEILPKGWHEDEKDYLQRVEIQTKLIKAGSEITIPRRNWVEDSRDFKYRLDVQEQVPNNKISPRSALESTNEFNGRLRLILENWGCRNKFRT